MNEGTTEGKNGFYMRNEEAIIKEFSKHFPVVGCSGHLLTSYDSKKQTSVLRLKLKELQPRKEGTISLELMLYFALPPGLFTDDDSAKEAVIRSLPSDALLTALFDTLIPGSRVTSSDHRWCFYMNSGGVRLTCEFDEGIVSDHHAVKALAAFSTFLERKTTLIHQSSPAQNR